MILCVLVGGPGLPFGLDQGVGDRAVVTVPGEREAAGR